MVQRFATIRLEPPHPTKLGEWDLDAVALECSHEGRVTDFRLELGQGLAYAWAVPVEPNGHLRLVVVDAAVAADVGPALLEDPYSADYSESWSGELGRIGEHVVTEVRLHVTRGGYRCQARVRRGDGSVGEYVLTYRA